MKVKISCYPHRLTSELYTRYMNKKYGFLNRPKQQTTFEDILEKCEDMLQSVYNVLNHVWLDKRTQTKKIQIDRWDTWSMDYTLAYIIVPMLKQLKDTKHGAPNVDLTDVPEDLLPNEAEEAAYKSNGETDTHFFDRWDWILDEMIWAFEQKCRDHWEEDFYVYEDDPTARFGIRLVSQDQDGLKAHHDRMMNGFRLFGRYYECLWDQCDQNVTPGQKKRKKVKIVVYIP